jgi:hypothetical protein
MDIREKTIISIENIEGYAPVKQLGNVRTGTFQNMGGIESDTSSGYKERAYVHSHFKTSSHVPLRGTFLSGGGSGPHQFLPIDEHRQTDTVAIAVNSLSKTAPPIIGDYKENDEKFKEFKQIAEEGGRTSWDVTYCCNPFYRSVHSPKHVLSSYGHVLTAGAGSSVSIFENRIEIASSEEISLRCPIEGVKVHRDTRRCHPKLIHAWIDVEGVGLKVESAGTFKEMFCEPSADPLNVIASIPGIPGKSGAWPSKAGGLLSKAIGGVASAVGVPGGITGALQSVTSGEMSLGNIISTQINNAKESITGLVDDIQDLPGDIQGKIGELKGDISEIASDPQGAIKSAVSAVVGEDSEVVNKIMQLIPPMVVVAATTLPSGGYIHSHEVFVTVPLPKHNHIVYNKYDRPAFPPAQPIADEPIFNQMKVPKLPGIDVF